MSIVNSFGASMLRRIQQRRHNEGNRLDYQKPRLGRVASSGTRVDAFSIPFDRRWICFFWKTSFGIKQLGCGLMARRGSRPLILNAV
jgi:hypothetical protein